MSVTFWAGNIIRCLSSDTKPGVFPGTAIPIPDGYIFIETDTGKEFVHVGAAWVRTDALATDTSWAAPLHSVTDQHNFPGGTTTYLRADGTWATPAGGSGTLVETHIPLVSLAVAQSI